MLYQPEVLRKQCYKQDAVEEVKYNELRFKLESDVKVQGPSNDYN